MKRIFHSLIVLIAVLLQVNAFAGSKAKALKDSLREYSVKYQPWLENTSTAGRNSLREVDQAVAHGEYSQRALRIDRDGISHKSVLLTDADGLSGTVHSRNLEADGTVIEKTFKIPVSTSKPQKFNYGIGSVQRSVERIYENTDSEFSRYEHFDVVDINGFAVRTKTRDLISYYPKSKEDPSVFGEIELKGNAAKIHVQVLKKNAHSAHQVFDFSQFEELKNLSIVNVNLEPNGRRLQLITLSNDHKLVEHTYDLNRVGRSDTTTTGLEMNRVSYKTLSADEIKRLGIFDADLKILKPRKAASASSRGVNIKTSR